MIHRRSDRVLVALLMALLVAFSPRMSLAQSSTPGADAPHAGGPGSPVEAEGHFRHGVLLYKDNDYAGALVEFRRAYDISPNYRVLFNIGQTYYQLQRYADALKAFEAYLAQGGAQVPAARRSALQNDLRLLQARVARVDVTVNVDAAEIRVDDEVVGTSPLQGPIVVAIGHRKVIVSHAGKAPIERFIDLASGDRLKLAFTFPDDPPAPVAVAPPVAPEPPPPVALAPARVAPPPEAPPAAAPSHTGAWVAWIATGLLAAGATTTGILTLDSRKDLSKQLATYPGDPALIEHDRRRTKTFATATDLLLATGLVSAGVALYLTFPSQRSSGAATVGLGLGLGPQGIELRGHY